MSKKSKQNPGDIRSVLYVEGMYCAACEILIKKTLEKVEGIISVKASISDSRVTITHHKGTSPDLKILNAHLKDHGYTLQWSKDGDSGKPLIYFENGSLLYNPEKMRSFSINFGIVALLVIGFYLLTESGLAARVMVTTEAGPFVYLLFGLVAGASTCAALVGGVILSLSKSWNKTYANTSDHNAFKSLLPHGMFYAGRLVSFAFAGGVLALVGASITSTVTAVAPVITILVAGVMLLLGLQMLNVSWATKLTIALPGSLGNNVSDSSESSHSTFGPLYIGAASLLLPCGMTLTAFITSISSGDFVSGALNMFAFAFGTMIALSFISLASVGFGSQKAWSGRFNAVAGVMVVFFALFTLNSQLDALGLPSMSDVARAFSPSTQTSATVLGDQSVQVMNMEASAYGYVPTSFTVKSGVPVRWEINNMGASGCTGAVIARDFFNGQVTLKPGVNVIEFTPQKPGTYKFSCWMGMVGGVIKVT
ncbi:hypothetical protein GW793_00650 [bacterium]|uniref:HMA domain-containing protein n=2 Tax=Katanobacteria TaxID=422282 RepID=A0A2M7X0U5_UNCKA|nr:hypothetical protein [bacterium]PIP56680.1 MAG: hypothetical protein COX05_01765 [candidate division WWE3 bacterium CG22_combo_CG10-13_8_21_14_all_39_12]PJA39787.1 MAG: hypothetical protein CO179_04455 [candidate division WWE3 bacterium CG_4_9_14_3_um_filter_39_7]